MQERHLEQTRLMIDLEDVRSLDKVPSEKLQSKAGRGFYKLLLEILCQVPMLLVSGGVHARDARFGEYAAPPAK